MTEKKYKPGQQMSFLENYVPGTYEENDRKLREAQELKLKKEQEQREIVEFYYKMKEEQMLSKQRRMNNKDLFGNEL